MRMAVWPPVAPPTPSRGALLRDTNQHHAEATIALRRLEILARDLLLNLAPVEAHHRDLPFGDEPLDRADVLAADSSQQRGRGDRKPPIEQKPDHLKLSLQSRHIALKEQPVH